ncbi:hypothetical protein K491DRAFT_338455 [Lophiostoma macrostomum CBS 122681]|uniref:Protein kinase domain-containing protein n=1 Tax=Lophiostoma macrostomum CBS 122681 TaxID=1314788 RepID=A0A6A6TQF4_9PLEO|nr:hypothetical protein K491DRAFT_338455 [Lophiostoma macrostomum CBS 122681]
MAAIQNFKNFLRHGKQARQNAPHGEPTSSVSPVHAQQQQRHEPQHFAISDPNVLEHKPLQGIQGAKDGGFSAAAVDNRNVAAKAGDVAARAAGEHQKAEARKQAGTTDRKGAEIDPSVLERIVAEEREAKGKLPRYPGLERWQLIEKMGDGAFSNVYRAKDTTGQYGEAAIKVVRKFEMNSTQGDNHMHPDFKKQPKLVESKHSQGSPDHAPARSPQHCQAP